MFKQIVEVAEVQGSKVKVRCQRKAMCSCCSLRFACAPRKEFIVVDANPGVSLNAGDTIEVGIEESKVFLGNVILFFVPSLIFVVLMILLRNLSVVQSVGIGIGALLVYYFLVKILLRYKKLWGDIRMLRKV